MFISIHVNKTVHQSVKKFREEFKILHGFEFSITLSCSFLLSHEFICLCLCVSSNNCCRLKLDSEQQVTITISSRDLQRLSVSCVWCVSESTCMYTYISMSVTQHPMGSVQGKKNKKEKTISFNYHIPPASPWRTFWHLVALIAPLELELWEQCEVQILTHCFY